MGTYLIWHENPSHAVIVSKYSMLCAVLFHQLLHLIPMTKTVDISLDNIKSARDQTYTRFLFHRLLNALSSVLLNRSQKQVSANTSNKASVSLNFEQVNAA